MASYLYEAEGRENVAREQETSEWVVLSTQLKLYAFAGRSVLLSSWTVIKKEQYEIIYLK